jgi:mono/diheme cytochrome c family protein
MRASRRALVVLAAALAAVGLFTGGLAWVLDMPAAPPGAPRAERLYVGLCASCHGADGRGSWRATLFLVKPGDLAATSGESDRYLFDIIEHGGAPIGRPGMPAFGATLSDEDIRLLVDYLRRITSARSGAA